MFIEDPLARQFYIEMARIEHWDTRTLADKIDLLFFHRGLRRIVAIDLKLGKFKPEYEGQNCLVYLKPYKQKNGPPWYAAFLADEKRWRVGKR